MSDLLFRGRGGDVGVRASPVRVRVAGAVLGFAIAELLAALGVWSALGVGPWVARAVCAMVAAMVAPSAVGAWLWYLGGSAGGLLVLVSFTPLVVPLFPRFVRHDVPHAGEPIDAIVVFSGTVNSEGRVTGDALDRLLTAMGEARRRQIGTLALSVVGDEHDAATPDSERDQRELAGGLAPELQLRFVRNVFSTRDEALAFSALARTHAWQRVIAITSPAHTRRACAALEHERLRVDCLPAVSRGFGANRLAAGEDRRHAFADILYESAATLLYRARGWL